MKKFKISFFLLLVTSFSVLRGDVFQDLLIKYRAEALGIPLTPDKILMLTIPEEYNYGYSYDQDGVSLVELVREGENVKNWTSLITIIFSEKPLMDFETYVNSYLKLPPPVYTENLEINCVNGIHSYLYTALSPAIKFPELEEIEGVDEWTMKMGFLGNDGFYTFIVAFRFDKNLPEAQKKRKYDGFYELLMKCVAIKDMQTSNEPSPICEK